jgi:hypothetical protein
LVRIVVFGLLLADYGVSRSRLCFEASGDPRNFGDYLRYPRRIGGEHLDADVENSWVGVDDVVSLPIDLR